jgi:hypothetical protein
VGRRQEIVLDHERNRCKCELREVTDLGWCWQSRPTARVALHDAIHESQVTLLTRLNSWLPLACELLL